jgi:urea transport system ATP-binding protein
MSLLELKDVTKVYNDYVAVENFNFSVTDGELRCLLGPNGAGKTTCIDLITGRQRLTSGAILFAGDDICRLPEQSIARLGIGRKFQVPAIFKELTVEDNLEVAFSRKKDPFANMMTLHRSYGQNRSDEIVELVGLKDRLSSQAGLLSHGETQWLEIGMVLIQDPRLLLMDEPTAGMTEQETMKTSEIFNSLKGSHTLVVVEHDMSFVREIADIITVMHMGTMLAEGTLEEIGNDPRVKEVYLGSEGLG